MQYPYQGGALGRRLALLAGLTVAGVVLVVWLAWVMLAMFDTDEPEGRVGVDAWPSTPSPSSPPTAPSTTPTTTTPTTTTPSTNTTSPTTTTLPAGERVLASLLDELSLENKVHQLVVAGSSGSAPLRAIGDALGTTCVGGVFVADNAGNWSPPGDVAAATAALAGMAEAAADCAIRPLVATDAEPGTTVLKVPVDPLPRPSALRAAFAADPEGSPAVIEGFAEAFARQLAGLGVHVNFGVVADVDADPGFFMARQGRSFGGDPAEVTAITRALVSGHCAAGVAPTLKHFPNQGATQADPHLAASVAVGGKGAWETRGRAPYVDTAAPLVMTGHIIHPGVDGDRPASLSSVITAGWLREELGYDGVVITDDLQTMRGVTELAPEAGRRAVEAVEAGADLVLFVGSADLGDVVAALMERAAMDRSFATRVDDAVERVVRLKAAFGLVDGLQPDWFPLCAGATGARVSG